MRGHNAVGSATSGRWSNGSWQAARWRFRQGRQSDLTIYRPSSGFWYPQSARTTTFSAYQWGAPPTRLSRLTMMATANLTSPCSAVGGFWYILSSELFELRRLPMGRRCGHPVTRRLRRRWESRSGHLQARDGRLAHPALLHRLRDVRQSAVGRRHRCAGAWRLRRRWKSRQGRLPAGDRHVVHPRVDYELHDVQELSVGRRRRHACPG